MSHEKPPTTTENELEALLREATTEPGRRPEFYRVLLESTVLAITARTNQCRESVRAGELLEVRTWHRDDGCDVIPFFSSAAALYEVVPEGAICVQLTARELFETTRGMTLHLNPDCRYGREFVPFEVDALLTHGSIVTVPQVDTPYGVQVTIGPAETPPQLMLASLIALYARLPGVRVAHLADVRGLESAGAASLVIGISIVCGDVESVARDTAAVIADTYAGSSTIDVYFVEDSGAGLSAYFRTAPNPFYDRAWGSRLLASSSDLTPM